MKTSAIVNCMTTCSRCEALEEALRSVLADFKTPDDPTVTDFMASRRHSDIYTVGVKKLHDAYLKIAPGGPGRTKFMRQVRALGYRTVKREGGIVVLGVLAN